MPDTKDESPIQVVVKDGRFDCYGPETDRSRYLAAFLTDYGVSDTVEDGIYHFNLIKSRSGSLYMTLHRVG
jgi:hypothetical protein